ncbi:hypothetical protein ACIQPT_20745 [Streptomyces sp. NPDC091289]|uniref:hypothetical protein n=1 Tax=Streptomyces sp. NPDC091289 TaxID=3365989 RepID=UPI00380BE6A3
MNKIEPEIFLADGGASLSGTLTSIAFFLIFGGFGFALAINLRQIAERFLDLTSKMLFGFAEGVDVRVARFVGACAALLSLVGIVLEISTL